MPRAGRRTATAAKSEGAARGEGGPASDRARRGAGGPADPRVGLPPALAVALGALVYLAALGNPFVYDDRATILNNPSLVDLAN